MDNGLMVEMNRLMVESMDESMDDWTNGLD